MEEGVAVDPYAWRNCSVAQDSSGELSSMRYSVSMLHVVCVLVDVHARSYAFRGVFSLAGGRAQPSFFFF